MNTVRQMVRIAPVGIEGLLVAPANARGLVIFAHGSGSGRHSPRNQHVATALNGAGIATLLVDLLSPSEARERSHIFNVELLGGRLGDATRWARGNTVTAALPIGYFGASTGAGAALRAAAEPANAPAAIVSRGGRPDLAGVQSLAAVQAPTLLIVGSLDTRVLALNREALQQLPGASHELVIVPGAGHLFEEPGTLDAVVRLAIDWFVRFLVPHRKAR